MLGELGGHDYTLPTEQPSVNGATNEITKGDSTVVVAANANELGERIHELPAGMPLQLLLDRQTGAIVELLDANVSAQPLPEIPRVKVTARVVIDNGLRTIDETRLDFSANRDVPARVRDTFLQSVQAFNRSQRNDAE